MDTLDSITQFTDQHILTPISKRFVRPSIEQLTKGTWTRQKEYFKREVTIEITTHTLFIISAYLLKSCVSSSTLLATAASVVTLYAVGKAIYVADKALSSYYLYRPSSRLGAFINPHPTKQAFGLGLLCLLSPVKNAMAQVATETVKKAIEMELKKLTGPDGWARKSTIDSLLKLGLKDPAFLEFIKDVTEEEKELYNQVLHLLIIEVVKEADMSDVLKWKLSAVFNNCANILDSLPKRRADFYK